MNVQRRAGDVRAPLSLVVPTLPFFGSLHDWTYLSLSISIASSFGLEVPCRVGRLRHLLRRSDMSGIGREAEWLAAFFDPAHSAGP